MTGTQGWGPGEEVPGPTTAAWYPGGAPRPQPPTAPVGGPPPPPGPPPGSAPPPPPAGPPTRRLSTAAILLIAAAVLVVVGGGIGVGVAIGTGDDPTTTSTPIAAATTTANDFPATTANASTAPATEPATVASTPPSSAPPSVSASGIDIAAIGSDPRAPAVVTVFDTYFTGINTHDPQLATSVFAPGTGLDPSDPDKVATFGEQTSTTTDSAIVIRSIAPLPDSGLEVTVTFTSNQAADYGPQGQTCTQWNIRYQLTPGGSGYLVVKGRATSAGC